MKKRLGRACMIIALLFAGVLAVDAILDMSPQTGMREQDGVGSARSAGQDAFRNATSSAADGAGRAAGEAFYPLSLDAIAEERGFGRTLPEDFVREAFDATGFDEVLVAGEGAIVGLIGNGSASETFLRLSTVLGEKGWVQVESGQSGIGTFVKAGGANAWLMLACFDAGDLVSVVVHVR